VLPEGLCPGDVVEVWAYVDADLDIAKTLPLLSDVSHFPHLVIGNGQLAGRLSPLEHHVDLGVQKGMVRRRPICRRSTSRELWTYSEARPLPWTPPALFDVNQHL
jgi:hypothetical protein